MIGPAGLMASASAASVSNRTTPTPSSSSSKVTNRGAESCSTFIRVFIGSPDGSSMLPERSRTSDVPTVGLGTTVAVIATENGSPVSGTSTVSVPAAAVPAAPGVNSTHTRTSFSSNPSGSGDGTDAARTVKGAVTEAFAVTAVAPRTRRRRARAVGRSSTTSRNRIGSPGSGATCSTVSGSVSYGGGVTTEGSRQSFTSMDGDAPTHGSIGAPNWTVPSHGCRAWRMPLSSEVAD
jgi:hypothetical protein